MTIARYQGLSTLSAIVALALVYFAAAKVGLALAFINASATAVWPPTGIALAALLVLGYRIWPGILLGAFLVNLTTSGSILASLMIAGGNTLEGLVGVYLINRFARGTRVFDRAQDIFKFVLLAALISTAVSATVGVTTLAWNRLANWTDYGPIWLTWWLGDATGALIVAPLCVLWAMSPRVSWNRTHVLEMGLLWLALISLGLIMFTRLSPIVSIQNYPLTFLFIPIIVWFAYRFGRREAATVTAIFSGIAIGGTLNGFGPFANYPQNESLLLLQAFMGVLAATGLIVGAIVSERQRANERLLQGGERHRIVVETATDAIITIDERSIITFINRAGEKIFGHRVSEMIGQPLTMLMPKHLRNGHTLGFARYRETGDKNIAWTGMELPGLHKDGHQIPLEISFGEFDQHGKHFITGIIRDITDRKHAEESQHWLATIVESSGDAIIGKTLDGTILSWNQAAERIYGYTAAETVGHPISMLVPPERVDEIATLLTRARLGERIEYYETMRVRKDGKHIHVSLTISPIKDAAGAVLGASTIVRDISEHKRVAELLRQREGQIRQLVDSNIIGVLFWDVNGGVSDANDAFLRIVGYTREDMRTGKINWLELTAREHRELDSRALEEMRQNGACTPFEKECIRKDGTHVPVMVGGAFLEGSQEQGVAFVLDVSERKHAEQRIRYMAQHDALTGLPNRLLFQDRVTHAIAQAHRAGTPLAVCFIDLDHFKDINDSLGHLVGDRLLRATARRLKSCLREDDSVARLGGDEFVICLSSLTDSQDAVRIAGKILEAMRRPILLDHHELHISGSLGISLYPDNGTDVEALMRTADTAMYHAKEKGRDNYQFFMPRLNEAAQRRLTIANRLHRALERNEFVLHYQPQMDLETGRIFSAEALLRWHQSDIGLIQPAEFIKIAEDTGLIVPLGEWVLRQACEQLRRWRGAGYPDMRITVNLSPHQLRRPGFPELAGRILQETGLPPDALEMELTEGILMMYSAENVTTLERLARMGIRLAVDDFGTGYSSLAYLQRFPIDVLKIDQSFVSGIGEDPNDTVIVSAIIAMAASLQLKVVAEGVETFDQAAFLKVRGCFAAQGFYYSKAVSARMFSNLLDNQTRIAPSA